MGPLLKPDQVPLDGFPSFYCIIVLTALLSLVSSANSLRVHSIPIIVMWATTTKKKIDRREQTADQKTSVKIKPWEFFITLKEVRAFRQFQFVVLIWYQVLFWIWDTHIQTIYYFIFRDAFCVQCIYFNVHLWSEIDSYKLRCRKTIGLSPILDLPWWQWLRPILGSRGFWPVHKEKYRLPARVQGS